MTKKSIDYSKTIIYKIVCKDLKVKDIYVGHTTDFTNRKYEHQRSCNNENRKSYNYQVYKFIRENGGWDNWEMILVEKYPCKDNFEARSPVRYWYETLKATLNARFPERKQKEWININQQKVKEYKKVSYEKLKSKNLKKVLCSCGNTYTEMHKERHLKTTYHKKHNTKPIKALKVESDEEN
jgi:hypothetical protein